MKDHDQEQIIAAAGGVAAGAGDGTVSATRLMSTAEPLLSVFARLELADEPCLLSVTATPLADVAPSSRARRGNRAFRVASVATA